MPEKFQRLVVPTIDEGRAGRGFELARQTRGQDDRGGEVIETFDFSERVHRPERQVHDHHADVTEVPADLPAQFLDFAGDSKRSPPFRLTRTRTLLEGTPSAPSPAGPKRLLPCRPSRQAQERTTVRGQKPWPGPA